MRYPQSTHIAIWTKKKFILLKDSGLLKVLECKVMKLCNLRFRGCVSRLVVIKNLEVIKSTGVIKNIEVIMNIEVVKNIEVIKNTEVIKNIEVIKSIEVIKNLEVIKNIAGARKHSCVRTAEALRMHTCKICRGIPVCARTLVCSLLALKIMEIALRQYQDNGLVKYR